MQLAELLAQPELAPRPEVDEGGVAEDQALLVIAADLRLVPLEDRSDDLEALVEEVAFQRPGGREIALVADQVDPADAVLSPRRAGPARRSRRRRGRRDRRRRQPLAEGGLEVLEGGLQEVGPALQAGIGPQVVEETLLPFVLGSEAGG